MIHAMPEERPRCRLINPLALTDGASDHTMMASSGIGQIGCACTKLCDRQSSTPGDAITPGTVAVAVTVQLVSSGAKRKMRPTAIPSPAIRTAPTIAGCFNRTENR